MVEGNYLEDFQIGDEFKSKGRTVTEADFVNFAGVSGCFHPIHQDEVYCKNTIFGKRIAHGKMVLAFMLGFWDRMGLTEDTIVAHAGINNLKFKKPVYIGDTLHSEIKILEKKEGSKADRGILVTQATCKNQNDETVLSYTDYIMIYKKNCKKAKV